MTLNKNYSLGLLTVSFAALVLIAIDNNEYKKQADAFTQKYEIRNPAIPSSLDFAGEEVPVNFLDVKERVEKEIISNVFFHSNTLLTLKRSKRFFEAVEPILKKHGIPTDFKYLAVIESNLVNAVSPSGAKGIWQFMPATGKSYGLEISDDIDERYHLEKSTEAACKYLKEAYNHFGSWTLAAASYNRGMAGIDADIRKQGVKNYFHLHLNTETHRYVPRILAIKTIFENQQDFGFFLVSKDFYAFPKTKEIEISEQIDNIADFALSMGSNYHTIKTLNPWLRSNLISGHKKIYTILIPQE